ncbi:MAG: lytic transglycosylase domain-containing protein [Magnetococcales bacterium]|nr:lytic transglycosylase domain-containing protein [Magnetococcales bacterium]
MFFTLFARGIKRVLTVAACAALVTSPLWAAPAEDEVVLAYRELFAQLDRSGPTGKLLERSSWPKNDLLASYLEFDILRHPDFTPSVKHLRDFMERYPDHPQMEKILKLMDNAITLYGDNDETLMWYAKRPPKTSAGIIRTLNLLIGLKRNEEAAKLWKQFYREGGLMPQSVLDFARDINLRPTLEDNEARTRALFSQGKKNLYRIQLQKLPKNRQTYFQALEAAKAGHPSFRKLVQKLSGADLQSSELWYEWINNLRTNNRYEESKNLLLGREGKWLTPEHRQSLSYRQARAMLYHENSPQDAFALLESNVREMGGKLDDSLWLSAYSAYLLGRRHVALERMQQLAMEGAGGERRGQGGYWAAKLLEAEGQNPKPMLEMAAQYPEHFYGLLASEALGKIPINPNEQQECLTLRANEAIAKDIDRLLLLRAVGRTMHNIQEIQSMAERHALSPRNQVCLAIAHTEADHIVKLAKKFQKEKGVAAWDGLFPVPKNWKPLTGWQLDPALIWSLARQESVFTPNAVSSAGAQGLIQLMPATAKGEAKLMNFPEPNSKRLSNPEYNLALGQNHLQGLIKRFNGDLALSIAAYNAGSGRSIQWREFRIKESIPHFYEKIHITETREYVKKVLHGYAAYQWVLYGKGSLSAMIQPGTPGLSAVAANRPLPKPVEATATPTPSISESPTPSSPAPTSSWVNPVTGSVRD